MNEHEEISNLLPAYALGELEVAPAERVRAHLAECPECRTELASLQRLLEHTEQVRQLDSCPTIDETAHRGLIDNVIAVSKQPTPFLHWRMIVKNRYFKFIVAAAAVIVLTFLLRQEPPFTGKAYGMADLSVLFKQARTVHMAGVGFLPNPANPTGPMLEQKIEYWFDFPNGRYKLGKPGGFDEKSGKIRTYTTVCDGKFVMTENYVQPLKGEPWCEIEYTRLTPFQARLRAHQFSQLLLNQFINLPQISGFKDVGRERIDGLDYTIWEGRIDHNAAAPGSLPELKIRCTLASSVGRIGRLELWTRRGTTDWTKLFDIPKFEFDVPIPDATFSTDPPKGYRLANSRETAKQPCLGDGANGGSVGDLSLNVNITFTLPDGSVLVAWTSTDKSQPDQAPLFRDLRPGGPLPKLPLELYALTTLPPTPNLQYTGYHLASTRTANVRREWSLYVPNNVPPKRNAVFGYVFLNRRNTDPKKSPGSISNSTGDDIFIETANDFDTWVRGAMAELSDEVKAPEQITYEYVMTLARQLRELADVRPPKP